MKEWLAKEAELRTWLDRITPPLEALGKDILAALLIFLIGRRIVKWLNKILKRSFERSNMEEGLSHFLLSFINITLNIIVAFMAVSVFDAAVTSIMAVLGSAGLTLGLALQGSLSNLAGGVLILIMRPFQVGDYIITGTKEEGTVIGIDIFYTHLLTIDNRRVVIPNGGLSNSSITNVTRESVRRLDLLVSVDYSENIQKVKKILLELLATQEMVLGDRPIDIYVNSFDPSAISIGLRVWTETENYWTLKWKLLEEIKEEFDRNEIVIPFNQLDVNISRDDKIEKGSDI
ncbi:MAG: mechanosensitive ion channel family protein [Acetivibrio ethanolgignens]